MASWCKLLREFAAHGQANEEEGIWTRAVALMVTPQMEVTTARMIWGSDTFHMISIACYAAHHVVIGPHFFPSEASSRLYAPPGGTSRAISAYGETR